MKVPAGRPMVAFHYVGAESGRLYDPRAFPWRGDGGELLELSAFPVSFPLAAIRARGPTLWRYAEALPLAPAEACSLNGDRGQVCETTMAGGLRLAAVVISQT